MDWLNHVGKIWFVLWLNQAMKILFGLWLNQTRKIWFGLLESGNQVWKICRVLQLVKLGKHVRINHHDQNKTSTLLLTNSCNITKERDQGSNKNRW